MTGLTIEELTERLENGVREVFESEQYRKYLQVLSRFHNYSYGNTLLILSQKPEATFVAGFRTWNDRFSRRVRKGEKAIRILSPVIRRIESEEEDERKKRLCGFRICSVFDISQTEGEDIPLSLARRLEAGVENWQQFLSALLMISPVPVFFVQAGSGNGCYMPLEKRICVRSDLSQSQTAKTLIHEITHALLHDADTSSDHLSRIRREVEAESVAYIVSTHFGIDTSSYSFGYIASWSRDLETAVLKSSLDTIQKTAARMITMLKCILYPAEAEEKDFS